jgi:8-oxo-dGTP diphosphatase
VAYTYEYPHPAVSVDVVVFTVYEAALSVLLIRRGAEPFRGRWALPGGFVEIDEGLEHAARRELKEETGVDVATVEQLRAFGDPGRDPRERVISVAHVALIAPPDLRINASSDADAAAVFPVNDLPRLAFDHDRILALARERLSAAAADPLYALRVVPETFTLPELQGAYECLSGDTADRRNFRKRVLGSGRVEPTGETRHTGSHRPANLYRRKDA